MTEEELAKWSADFRGDPEPLLTPEEIVALSARDERRARLQWIEQIGGLAFALAAFLAIVVRARSWLLTALSAVVLPTLVALFGYFVHLTLAHRGALARSVREHADVLVKRRRAAVRLLSASRAAQGFLALVFWAWFPFFVHARADRFAAQPWRIAVGAGASAVIFGASWIVLGRKLRRARAELERCERTVSSLDGDADRAA